MSALMDNEKAVLIANLQEQLSIFDTQLATLEAQTPLDITQYNAIRAEREEAQKKLDAVNAEINAGIEAQEEIASQFENITIGDDTASLRDLIGDEIAYQIISIFFQQKFGDQAQKHAAVVASYQSQVEKLQSDMADYEEVKAKLFDTLEQLEDMTSKRDAAVAQTEEELEEKKRLAADNESLRKQLESTSKPSQSDDNTSAAELLAKWKAKRPIIYNKRWKDDLKRTTYLAELATTGETIEFNHLEAGKYQEVSEAEAETFREQDQPTVEENVVPSEPLVEPPPAIPSETEDAGVQTDSTSGEMVSEAVSRAEFQALKDEVDNIKRTLNMEVAA